MDPLLPPHPTTIVNPNPPGTAISNATALSTQYVDSTVSSPRSRQTDNCDEPLPQVPGAKLRLMCSFGGHIIPRPHDKSLCYVGGETRIVVVDRNFSLSDVQSRLSRTLLGGHKFAMKYQLPNEELDSLISVTSDEDLENMIEECDRIMATTPVKPARIRLFLFLAKPETAASMGALLDDAKSETWFVDTLNNSDLFNRGVSDSVVIDNLLDFDGMVKNDSSTNLEGHADAPTGENQAIKIIDPEVHKTIQGSPMAETSSSFDSGLSSPSMENLPPIKVRVNENTVGLDEQFSQMHIAPNGVNHIDVSKDNVGRVTCDDDISDKSMSVALRKPPMALHPVQRKFTDFYNLPSPDSRQAGSYNLKSPDSVASDSSFTSSASFNTHSDYQDPSSVANQDNRVFGHALIPRNHITQPSSQIHFQSIQEPAVIPSLNQNPQAQQQFIHVPLQYIQHPATGLMQVPSYYPMYAATPTTQKQFHQQQNDQRYPVYLMPTNQAQQYNLPHQSSIVDATAVASSVRPPNQPTVPGTDAELNRTVQGPAPTYVQVPPNQFQQQYYGVPHVQPQTQTMPTEADAEARKTVQAPTPTPTPTLTYIQVPHNQYQQQYYGVSHVHPHTQTMTTGQAGTTNYSYNYTHLPHDQLNYVHHAPQTPIPSQYQTITPATVLLISQATSQLAADNASQQIKTSQPQ